MFNSIFPLERLGAIYAFLPTLGSPFPPTHFLSTNPTVSGLNEARTSDLLFCGTADGVCLTGAHRFTHSATTTHKDIKFTIWIRISYQQKATRPWEGDWLFRIILPSEMRGKNTLTGRNKEAQSMLRSADSSCVLWSVTYYGKQRPKRAVYVLDAKAGTHLSVTDTQSLQVQVTN